MTQPYWYPGDFWAWDSPQKRLEFGDLAIVTPTSGSILSVDDNLVKVSLRIDQTTEDSLLANNITTAMRWCEERYAGGRQFLTATYSLPVSGWWRGELRVPLPPLRTATVSYYAADGTLTTLATTFYEVRTPYRQMGTIARLPDQVWPTLQCDRKYPVTIQFSAGYGTASSIPAAIKQAMILYCQWQYDQLRGDLTEGGFNAFESAIDSLLRTEGRVGD